MKLAKQCLVFTNHPLRCKVTKTERQTEYDGLATDEIMSDNQDTFLFLEKTNTLDELEPMDKTF